MNNITTFAYKGDTIELLYQLYKDKSKDEYWDLTDYKIRAVVFDDNNIRVKLGTSNVTGGSNDEINIITADKGIFLITISEEISETLIPKDYGFAIQIESPEGKKTTILFDYIRIKKALIDWENINE